MCKGDHAWEQYRKIQDYVIYNRLYKNKPSNLSHADILINEVNRLKQRDRLVETPEPVDDNTNPVEFEIWE